ncbi:hypothetical protein Tco_0562565 [Tanacetum coccineum]
MELESTNSGPTAKLPILKLGEYEMWAMRIKQYFQIQDYALWEVIKMLTFSQYPDAKSMFAAIETRFRESLDSIFNRLQKIVSRLAILGVIIAQDDLNLKFLSSLPPSIDDLEAMDLKWQLSLLSVRAKKWSVTTVISWDTLPWSTEQQEARKISSEIKTTPGSQETNKISSEIKTSHPLIYNRPNKLDLSYSGLDEFKEPEFKGYGPENSKKESNIVKESDNSKENSDKSLVKELESQVKSSFVKDCGCNTSKKVSEVEPKKVRENNDAPIIEDWVSDDEEQDESITKPEKKTITPCKTPYLRSLLILNL